jgi:hypothetical protein
MTKYSLGNPISVLCHGPDLRRGLMRATRNSFGGCLWQEVWSNLRSDLRESRLWDGLLDNLKTKQGENEAQLRQASDYQ